MRLKMDLRIVDLLAVMWKFLSLSTDVKLLPQPLNGA
jgi:hypothetical protein